MKKGKRVYKLNPRFEPLRVEVFLDEGMEEMRGFVKNLMITDIQYTADRMVIKCRL
jgi:hypothetical protein